MAKAKQPKEEKLKSIKIQRAYYNKVRENKGKTGVNIGRFVELAIDEKLVNDKSKINA